MRRHLTAEEKAEIHKERLDAAREAFPELNIEVVVEDFTFATGEPSVRIISKGQRVPTHD
jgi:hypothetical protein